MYKDVGFRNIASYICCKVPLHHCFSLIRFKDVEDPGGETQILSTSDPEKNRTFSFGSKPCKNKYRQRMNTFSHCQYYTIKGNVDDIYKVKDDDDVIVTETPDYPDGKDSLPRSVVSTPTSSITKTKNPDLAIQITPLLQSNNFPEVDDFCFTR